MKNLNATSAGILFARKVLADDLKTTNADLDFLAFALIEIQAGRGLVQAQAERVAALWDRAAAKATRTVKARRPILNL